MIPQDIKCQNCNRKLSKWQLKFLFFLKENSIEMFMTK